MQLHVPSDGSKMGGCQPWRRLQFFRTAIRLDTRVFDVIAAFFRAREISDPLTLCTYDSRLGFSEKFARLRELGWK